MGRARHSDGRLLVGNQPCRELAVAQAQSVVTSSSRVDLGPGRSPWYKVINERSRDIRVAGEPSHFADLSEESCLPLRRFRGQDDKTTDRSSTIQSSWSRD